jgi:predicted alpha/beta superfamily hydrolase
MTASRRQWLAGAITVPAWAWGAEEATELTLPGTQVHQLADANGRLHRLWVDVPASLKSAAGLRPAVFVTDAPYAFPLVRALRGRVGQGGQNIEDFVLVGLAPPADEAPASARQRDYTPTVPRPRPGRYGGTLYGGAADHLAFLQTQVLPFVAERHRIDPARRVFVGHSYGALFGAYVLLRSPSVFASYVLGSPSLWFDDGVVFRIEADAARSRRDLPARVLLACGAYETVRPGARYNRETDLLRDMERFARTLKTHRYAGLSVDSRVVADEDHLTVAPAIATRGLLWALPGRGPYVSG